MTQQQSPELTVLFADICRSTILFDELGDEAALEIVMQALQLSSDIVKQQNGTVIGTIGDEVMCTFEQPEDALITANQIHSRIKKDALMQEHQIAMRVGINSGPVVNVSDNVYGDTVNIAARLAQQAKANQSLVSSATIASLNRDLPGQLRLIGEMNLQGKAGAIEVHELMEPEAKEEITQVSRAFESTKRSFLLIINYQNQGSRLNPMLVRFLFGRSPECDTIVNHPTVSREHAEILYRNGQFILRDFSTNGSLIVQGDDIERVHRSSTTLRGSGCIYLGRTLNQHPFSIEFTCQ